MTYTQNKPIALSAKNIQAYHWIRCYILESGGRSPSLREIMKGLGLKSPAPVQAHLRRLREAGYLDWADGQTRSLKLISDPVQPIVPADASLVAARLEAIAKRTQGKVKRELLEVVRSLQTA